MSTQMVQVKRVGGDVMVSSGAGALLPVVSKVEGLRVRSAVQSDLPFIDALLRKHSKAVGWATTGQLEGNIAKGQVLIAEEVGGRGQGVVGSGKKEANDDVDGQESGLPTAPYPLPPTPVGYCISIDKYFKREDVGIVYQMNVVPGYQRGLVGATLLKSVFERAAWGVRLFCCWCAQDLAANRFWEAMGFVPIAFRTGSRTNGKGGEPRVHIFWQKRIVAGDESTPWWYPSKTGGGALCEDRLVLPIPAGMHWSEAKPIVLPGMAESREEMKQIEGEAKRELSKVKRAEAKREAKEAERKKVVPPPPSQNGTLWFAPPPGAEALGATKGEGVAKEDMKASIKEDVKRKRKRVVEKYEPALETAARNLHAVWKERVMREPWLIGDGMEGKYDVSRRLEGGTGEAGRRCIMRDGGANRDKLELMDLGQEEETRERKLLPQAA